MGGSYDRWAGRWGLWLPRHKIQQAKFRKSFPVEQLAPLNFHTCASRISSSTQTHYDVLLVPMLVSPLLPDCLPTCKGRYYASILRLPVVRSTPSEYLALCRISTPTPTATDTKAVHSNLTNTRLRPLCLTPILLGTCGVAGPSSLIFTDSDKPIPKRQTICSRFEPAAAAPTHPTFSLR